MARSIDSQLIYTGGELSPLMDARIDHPKYQSGCRQMQNMIVLKQGGATRRPGTIFKGYAKYSNDGVNQFAVCLKRFLYSPTTSFILEFGHKYVRFYSNKQQVVLTTAPGWVNGKAYVPGDFVTDPGDLNNIYYNILGISGAAQPHLDPAHWVKQAVYEVPSPYNGAVPIGGDLYTADVWRITPCQINDVVYLVHPNYPPYKLVRLSDTNWKLTQVAFQTPPLLDENATTMFANAFATTGNTKIQVNADVWATGRYYAPGRSVNSGGSLYTAIRGHISGLFATDNANGFWRQEIPFTTGNIGGYFQIGHRRDTEFVSEDIVANIVSAKEILATGKCNFSTYGTWAAIVTLERSDNGGTAGGGSFYPVKQIQSENDHNGSIDLDVEGDAYFRLVITGWTAATGFPRAVFQVVEGVIYGLAVINSIDNPFVANVLVLEKFLNINTSPIWSEGAWSTRRGFPQAITAFQGRMMYGGSEYEPLRIWGSVVDDFENFDRGDQDKDTDSVAFDLAAVGRGRMQWLIGQVDLFTGFLGAEWIVNGGQGSVGGSNLPITPTQISAGEHTAWGSATGIPPAVVGNNVLYAQRAERTIQQMQFSVYTNKYQSNDITGLSEHLFAAGIVQIAYQPQMRNQSVIWLVTRGGSMCGMTYDMQTEVYGWHRHLTNFAPDTELFDKFESVGSIDGVAKEDDQIWVVVNRAGMKHIELMNPGNWETAGPALRGIATPVLSQAIYVDCSGTAIGPFASETIPGFAHLSGKNVIGLIDDKYTFGPVLVNPAGEVVIPGLDYANTLSIQIGLPIHYAIQSMRLDVDRGGIVMGITKALSRVYLRLFNSLSGRVQGSGIKQIPVEYAMQKTVPGQLGPLFTGEKDVTPESDQSNDPAFVVNGSDPLPLTLLASTVRVGITGSA